MVIRRRIATFALLALVGCSASESTFELSVDLRTDYAPAEEFDAVAVSVDPDPIRRGAEDRSEHTSSADALAGADYLAGVRVADVRGVRSGRQHVLVRLLRAGETIAESRALVAMDESRVLTMVVSRSCEGVSCPGAGDPAGATACLGGVCVDPQCDRDDPDSCGVGECGADTDCPDPAGCLRAACVAGACLEARDDAACPGGVCGAGGECVAAPTDGGAADGGAADGGAADLGSPDLGLDLSDRFCPAGVTTRGEFARFAVRFMHPDFDPSSWTHRGTFVDVPASAPFAAEIERFAADGITSGCETDRYCPGDPVLRWQAAVFVTRMLRGVAFTPPDIAGIYTDVPDGASHHDFVEYLRTEGIMNGCGATTFCPMDPLTRLQAAVVFVRMVDGPSPSLPPYVGYFSDVPAGNAFARHIERFAVLGFTNGC